VVRRLTFGVSVSYCTHSSVAIFHLTVILSGQVIYASIFDILLSEIYCYWTFLHICLFLKFKDFYCLYASSLSRCSFLSCLCRSCKLCHLVSNLLRGYHTPVFISARISSPSISKSVIVTASVTATAACLTLSLWQVQQTLPQCTVHASLLTLVFRKVWWIFNNCFIANFLKDREFLKLVNI